jgi:hypothetical protein
MSQQTSLTPPSKEILTKVTLLERIYHYRSILEATISSLSESQLSAPGPESWAIKDHLVHIAVWEQGVVTLLQKGDRFAAMGVADAFRQGKSETEINDLIYRQHKDQPVQEIRRIFQASHAQMLKVLDKLSDADLNRPYSDYVPAGDPNRLDPVMYWIIGNTYAHFDEHTAYIRNLLEGP